MNALSNEQVATLRKLLDTRLLTLQSAMHEHVARLRDSSAPEITTLPGDPADQTELALVRDHENAALVRDMRVLIDIDAARGRLDGAEAGVCVDCGGEIGFERLQAQPTATRCVYCQAAYEQTHLPVSAVLG